MPSASASWPRVGWLSRLVARPGFQRRVARLPFGAHLARRDGAEIFDILQGFVSAQVLSALVELGVLDRLLAGPAFTADLVRDGIESERMQVLLQAGAALGLLIRRRDGRFALARKGAAILGVPGLCDMIRHNRAFYKDMNNPVSLMRGERDTALARFWPYVFGAGVPIEPEESARYSDLMARSQVLVADDTLRAVRLAGVRRLMDVGGGAGVFLGAALSRYPALEGMVFDLPGVRMLAEAGFARDGLQERARFVPGSFREGPLPRGADAISLVRVLYDHADETVADLLTKAYAALPSGGRLIISEPMSGGDRPDRAVDVYFAFYTMAMGTGQVRSANRIAGLCTEAGFRAIRTHATKRSFVTSVVSAEKP